LQQKKIALPLDCFYEHKGHRLRQNRGAGLLPAAAGQFCRGLKLPGLRRPATAVALSFLL